MPQKTRILIVEDERIAAEDLRLSLESLGFDVVGISASGEAALEQAASGHPHLVLMDIVLRGKLNGIGTALELRRRHDLPVIYITAYSDPDTVERIKESEPYGYIHKPFDFRELQIVIETALIKYRMEQKLREREEWFSTTLKSIGDGVIAVDQAGKITFMNQAAVSLTGWSPEEAQGQAVDRVFRIVNERTLRTVENPVKKVLRQGRIIGMANHTILIRKDGGSIPIDDSGSPIRNDRGEITGVVLVFKDITEKKTIEQTLRDSENRYRRLVETSPDAIKLIAPDGRILFANRKAAAMCGYSSPERMTDLDAFSLVAPESRKIMKKDLEALARGEKPVNAEYTFLKKNGSRFPVEMSASSIRNASGEIQSIITIVRDVSERQRAMRRISSLSKFPDENPNPILRVSGRGNLLYSNHAGHEILDHWKCGIGGKVPPVVRKWLAQSVSGKSSRPLDVEIDDRNFSLSPSYVPEEGYVNVFGRDVTLQKQVESLKNQHLHEQTVLAGVSKILMNLRTLDALYEPLASLIAMESGADYLAVSEYDSLLGGLHLKTLLGVEKAMNSLLRLCGRDPRNEIVTYSELDAKQVTAYTSRRLIPADEGVYELSAGRLSLKTSRAVERLLGIRESWVMGFNCKGKLLGGIALFFKNQGTLRNRHLIETIVNQAALMIQHLAAEEKLRKSETRLRSITETMETGIWLLDERVQTSFINRAAAAALGYRAVEMTGRPLSDFLSKKEFIDHQKRMRNKGNGRSSRFEVRFQCKNGQSKRLSVETKPIKDEAGHDTGSIAMIF